MALKDPPASLGTLGNYDLVKKIGSGSMGTVYRARHWVTKDVVAIKVMPSNIASNTMLLRRFEQEFRIASKVHHPNVVRVLEYIGHGREPYLVMEFIDGVSLGERLEREGRISEEEAVRIIVQVAEGLAHAHERSLLHRDVKPDNILLTADGVAKLTDLGLGKEMEQSPELTRPGSGLGTPNFMAPEQFRNAKNADVRCDVYSLAATFYQMVSGELPFGNGDPIRILMRKLKNELTPVRQLAPQLTAQTERAIERAMDPDPERRTPTCRAFLADLAGEPTVTAASVPAQRPTPVPSRDTATMRRPRIEARPGDDSSARPRPSPAPATRLSPLPPASALLPSFPAARSPAPTAPAAPALPRPLSDHWKTGLIIAVTAAATLVVSQLLFMLLK